MKIAVDGLRWGVAFVFAMALSETTKGDVLNLRRIV
jgi:hypothetical protein